MADTFNVYSTLPLDGELAKLRFASEVSADAAKAIAGTSVWTTEWISCAEDQQTAAEPFAAPATTRLTPAAEYEVWMQYPAVGGKVPWGLVARGVPPEQAEHFLSGLHRRVRVIPAA